MSLTISIPAFTGEINFKYTPGQQRESALSHQRYWDEKKCRYALHPARWETVEVKHGVIAAVVQKVSPTCVHGREARSEQKHHYIN